MMNWQDDRLHSKTTSMKSSRMQCRGPRDSQAGVGNQEQLAQGVGGWGTAAHVGKRRAENTPRVVLAAPLILK